MGLLSVMFTTSGFTSFFLGFLMSALVEATILALSSYAAFANAASLAAWVCWMVFCLLTLVTPMPLFFSFYCAFKLNKVWIFSGDSLSSFSSPSCSSLSSASKLMSALLSKLSGFDLFPKRLLTSSSLPSRMASGVLLF